MQTRPTYSWEKYKNKWMEKTQSFSINDAMAPTHVETQRMNFNLHLTFHIKSTPVAPGCFQPEPQWCSSILLTWSLQHLRPATCPGMLPWSPGHSVLLSHPCNIKYQLAFRPLWEVLWSPIVNPEWTHHNHNHLCMCTVCMPGAHRGWRGHCISWNLGTSSYELPDVGVGNQTHIWHCYGISNRGSFVSQLEATWCLNAL